MDGATAGVLSGAASVLVEDAELWWTHDLGAQPRYQATIRLRDGEQVLDERRDQIGLRTIALDRGEDPEGGRHFRFVLNGVPIFARGAAWLPADMLVGSVSEARYRELLSTARDGQMTMLRIWGGGIYEHDAFYTLCDELDYWFGRTSRSPAWITQTMIQFCGRRSSGRQPTRYADYATMPAWRCGAATTRSR